MNASTVAQISSPVQAVAFYAKMAKWDLPSIALMLKAGTGGSGL